MVDLKLVVVPGNPLPGQVDMNLYSEIADFFFTYWRKHFKKVGSEKSIEITDFTGQDRIMALFYRGDIVASFALRGNFLFDDGNWHPYFYQFTPDYRKLLVDLKLRFVQSMQWLMVNQHLPEELAKLNLAEVLVAIAQKYQVHLGYEASTASARMDNPCAHVLENLNFKRYFEPVIMHNSPLAQLLCQQPHDSKKLHVLRLSSMLWEQKADFTEQNNFPGKTVRRAA